ncbi:hypothetical protein ACF07D_04735 [Leucobacter sp. NPDC015123]|uniref:hypothetical protein n=1 Tax=Leucobacter sp. NPDC015123 TaxID=3364129 RepID=UPI0036F461F7
MSRFVRCDNCGKDFREPFARRWFSVTAAPPEAEDAVVISLEHNEDVQNADACSWACVAELALKQSTTNSIKTLEEEVES